MNAIEPAPHAVGHNDWRSKLVKPVVPEGEGPGVPLSMRYPKKLLERVDACADETGHNRTDTIMHLLRWALEEFETQRAAERQPKAKK